MTVSSLNFVPIKNVVDYCIIDDSYFPADNAKDYLEAGQSYFILRKDYAGRPGSYSSYQFRGTPGVVDGTGDECVEGWVGTRVEDGWRVSEHSLGEHKVASINARNIKLVKLEQRKER